MTRHAKETIRELYTITDPDAADAFLGELIDDMSDTGDAHRRRVDQTRRRPSRQITPPPTRRSEGQLRRTPTVTLPNSRSARRHGRNRDRIHRASFHEQSIVGPDYEIRTVGQHVLGWEVKPSNTPVLSSDGQHHELGKFR